MSTNVCKLHSIVISRDQQRILAQIKQTGLGCLHIGWMIQLFNPRVSLHDIICIMKSHVNYIMIHNHKNHNAYKNLLKRGFSPNMTILTHQ